MAANLPPYLPVALDFNGNTLAGSGTVTRGTYTVPAGKRAVLTDVSVVIAANANAANTTQGIVRLSIGGTLVRAITLDGSGSANQAAKERVCNTELQAGDTVNLLSVNTGAGNVIMILDAAIREYQ